MKKASTKDRRAEAVQYLKDRAPQDVTLRDLRAAVAEVVLAPRLAPLRQRQAVAKAAQLILDTGPDRVVPSLAVLLKEDWKGELHILRALAAAQPDPYEEALTRCPDERARLAFAFARYCELWHLKHFGARFVLEAAIAWGVEPAPLPLEGRAGQARERALLRAWEGRVSKARRLARWTRDTTFDAWRAVLPEEWSRPLKV